MAGLLSEDASHLAFAADGTSFLTNGKLEEPDYSSTNWYFLRDEIEKNSPSRKDGVDLKKETYFRKSYCTFLQDLGMRLKVPQVTIATAIVLCHRFFLRQSHARNDKFMVGTVCMFLAGKVEETPRPLRDVVILSYELRNKKDPVAAQRIRQKKDVYEDQKELLLLGECLVLTTLEFDMNIHHPYKPLVTAIKRFKVAQIALAQVAWNFVNDGNYGWFNVPRSLLNHVCSLRFLNEVVVRVCRLRTSLCLQFKPHHIAAGAIFLATKFLKVKLPSDGEKVWWHEFEVTPRQLEDVSNQMLELYEQNKAGPSSRPSDLSFNAGGCNGYKTEILNGEHLEVPLPENGVSQSSQVGSFNATHDQVLADSANAAPSVSHPEVDFGSRDSSKEHLHGGRRQGAYAAVSEDRAETEMLPNSQEPVYYNHNKADINAMSGFKKWPAVGQELSGATAIHGKESPNGRNDMHVLPGAAATQKVNYVRPESQGDKIVRQDGIYGHRKPSEEKRPLVNQLKRGTKKIAEVNKIRKEDEGKRRPLVNLQEVEIDSVKASSEKKRKPKVGGPENLFGVKREVAIKTELAFRELENAVEATAGEDMFKSDLPETRRSHQSRDNTSSLEIANDHEAESWSSAKHKKLINTAQPYYNTKEKRDYEKGNLQTTNMQMVESYQGTADQVEEGEFGLQKHNYFSKVSNEEHVAPDTFGKASSNFGQMLSLHPGTREGSYEKKHWHGDSQTSLISGHHQQVQKSDQDINRHRHKDQVWQERDSKKIRRDHLK